MTGEGQDAPGGSTAVGGGGLVGTIAQVGGMIYNAAVNRKNTKDTIAANKQQAEYAYSKDLEQWNRENEYNSPAAQMARLKAAGINPNFGFASGGGSSGNATGSGPQYHAPTIDYSSRGPLIDVPQTMAMYQDFQMRQAQIDNVRAQTTNVDARTANEASRGFLLGRQGEKTQYEGENLLMLRPYMAEVKENEARKSHVNLAQAMQQLRNMKMSEVTARLQNEERRLAMQGMSIENQRKAEALTFEKYRNELSKIGLTTSDNPVYRLLYKFVNGDISSFLHDQGWRLNLPKD